MNRNLRLVFNLMGADGQVTFSGDTFTVTKVSTQTAETGAMIRACRRWATLAVLFAQALLPAASVAETTAGVWSSGYQMGSFWAAVKSPSGDSLSFSCSEGAPDTPYIRKGVSMRAEIAAIAEQGYRVGRTVDVALRTKSEVVALPMLVEGGGAMGSPISPRSGRTPLG